MPVSILKKLYNTFDTAFGLWKDRDISTKQIREKAWDRS